jgi:hypothetical protein
MKRLSVLFLFAALALVVTPACKKSGGSTEATLAVTITPVNGSTNLNLLGPDFPLKVEITSAMPPSGVKIEIAAKKDGSADPAYFTSSNNSNAAVNNYTITSTPSSVTCVVTVTVTSVSNSGNKWTGSYRYSKK